MCDFLLMYNYNFNCYVNIIYCTYVQIVIYRSKAIIFKKKTTWIGTHNVKVKVLTLS